MSACHIYCLYALHSRDCKSQTASNVYFLLLILSINLHYIQYMALSKSISCTEIFSRISFCHNVTCQVVILYTTKDNITCCYMHTSENFVPLNIYHVLVYPTEVSRFVSFRTILMNLSQNMKYLFSENK